MNATSRFPHSLGGARLIPGGRGPERGGSPRLIPSPEALRPLRLQSIIDVAAISLAGHPGVTSLVRG